MDQVCRQFAEANAGDGALCVDEFERLRSLIGTAKLDEISIRFVEDLRRRFGDRSDRDALRRDAHAITSTAGMMGLTSLSDAAARLERACDGGGTIDPHIDILASERNAAIIALQLRARHSAPGGSAYPDP